MNWTPDSYEWMGEVANYTGDQLGGDNSNDPSHLKFRYTLIQNVVDQWIWASPLEFITGSGNGGRPTRTQDTIQKYNPEFDLWDSRC